MLNEAGLRKVSVARVFWGCRCRVLVSDSNMMRRVSQMSYGREKKRRKERVAVGQAMQKR